ncbi:MAG: hypothetical protein HXS41_01210 [Theionarchaea archaeon]|nr:hypothetical protein [Theionarchaea archaeon]MBU6999229.1 hypothetical protein [Theionarchaea archaeon]MBU7019646.1 hypothetical protein [Theionarchaea archaeon]MBU7034566.1 hypothetical protein [Theionarchaea archaeon]MBU7040966.1 hypothetical protein [Theionarchaea archaeon]
MNIFGKAGFALVVLGGLIFAGLIIYGIVEVLFQFFVQGPLPLSAKLVLVGITAFVLGIILMLLSAAYDRYRTVKTEEVHEKV